MKYRKLYDGTPVPVIGLGAARYDPHGSQDAAAIATIRRAIELGMTHIDTAEAYGGGHSEKVIAEAIHDLDRESLFITSKVAESNLRYKDVHASLQATLKRLNTGYLDLYLIHSPNDAIPIEETFRALNELLADGYIRHVGVSNFSVEQMKGAMGVSRATLATNQVHYSLRQRAPQRDGVLDYCRRHGMLLTAYTPLEIGELALREELKELARPLGATAAQLALAWLVRQEGVITIPYSVDVRHVEEDAAAADLELPEETVRRLEEMVPSRATS